MKSEFSINRSTVLFIPRLLTFTLSTYSNAGGVVKLDPKVKRGEEKEKNWERQKSGMAKAKARRREEGGGMEILLRSLLPNVFLPAQHAPGMAAGARMHGVAGSTDRR